MTRDMRKDDGKSTDRRTGGTRRLADLIPAVGDLAFRKFGFVQSALITRWPEIAGDRIARVTQPQGLRFARGTKAEGTLKLTVTSAAAPMVQHLSGDLMAAVNRFFGYRAVARIDIVQGVVQRSTPTAPQTGAQTSAQSSPPIAEPVRMLAPAAPSNASVRAVADPELRAVLEGLAASLAKRDGPPKIS
jgi:hypothetical protein